MKILRVLLRWLTLAAVLAAVFVAVAFAPSVQTWVAQMALNRQPGLQGSVGRLAARFGKVEVASVKLTIDGAVLTLPSLEAELPLIRALWDRKLHVRKLVAKGWTLDLSRNPGPAGAAAPAGPMAGRGAPVPLEAAAAESAVRAFRGTLSRWSLPCDASLDGVDLEGDIVVATVAGGSPAPVHVIIKGGGMAAGREGAFAVDASAEVLDSEGSVATYAGHGRLVVAMKTPRIFGRVEAKADLSANGGLFPNGIALTADVAVALGPDDETYALDVNRGDRHLATIAARFPEAPGRIEGTWKVDLRDADVASVVPRRPLPHFAAVGDGRFDTDTRFAKVHALGRLNAVVSQWETIGPYLGWLRPGALNTEFDVVQTGKTLRVDRWSVSLTGNGTAASAQALQPFTVDEATGRPEPANPADDWVEISLRGVPLGWLSVYTDGFEFSGGAAAGEFVVRDENGTFALRSRSPLTAAGVAVERAGRTVARSLDFSGSLFADCGSTGWHLQAAPLNVSSGGSRLAAFEVRASRAAGPNQAITVHGVWNADLQAPVLRDAVPDLRWTGGRSISGDFSATVGAATEVDAKLEAVGRDAHRSITASVHATAGEDGRVSFLAPVKVALGSSASDLSVEGTLLRDEAETDVYLKLNGKVVDLEHLRLLTGAVAAAGGWPLAAIGGPVMAGAGRDRIPFWGDWAGRVTVAFDHLRAGDMVFDDVGGAIAADHHALHVEEGRGGWGGHRLTKMEGSLSFDAAADLPYDLKATAAVDSVDVSNDRSTPDPAGSPLVEGRFSVTGSLAGTGMNLGDLIIRAQTRVRLASTAGIVRVFKTDVDEAMPPETASPVSDTLSRMGSAVGSFFGVQDSEWGRKKVSPEIQTVIDIVNDTREIGWDEFTVTATRGPDRAIRLVDLAMTAGDLRVTGTGQIAEVKGQSFRTRPLRLDLEFGARGPIAKLLAAAGLLSTRKDDLGYALVDQPISLGGTLEHIDNRQWHDLLVRAAKRSPSGTNKTPKGPP